MKITKTGEYAIKAMIELAINYDKGVSETLISHIAGRGNIPPKYLEQILVTLKRGGVVTSKRGVGGGYTLSRPPSDISLGEIIRVVEGPLAPLNCASKKFHVTCPHEPTCGLYSVMCEVRNAIANVVDNISLKDVVNRTRALVENEDGISCTV